MELTMNRCKWMLSHGDIELQILYSLTHPNNSMQVFQSLPWPQVYKFKHLGMQTASTNICERMGRSQELSEVQRGTVIGPPNFMWPSD